MNMSEQESNKEKEMTSPTPEEVSRLVVMLRDGISTERRSASIAIGRLALTTRGPSPSRGTIGSSQRSEFPGDYQSYLEAAMSALQDASPEVRREVAYILGEWGDEAAVDIVRRAV